MRCIFSVTEIPKSNTHSDDLIHGFADTFTGSMFIRAKFWRTPRHGYFN